MIGFDEACERVAALTFPVASEKVALGDAYGRRLAAAVTAAAPAPAVAVSAMDGYAVRDADLGTGGARLRVAGESFAGAAAPPGRLEPGCCVRIFTGAAVPKGADRVVIQEQVRREDDEAVFEAPAGGHRHIRAAGSDFVAGEVMLGRGRRLTPQALVAAAAADRGYVDVYRRPQVAILSTGDELADPGFAVRRPGAIPDSVSLGVAGLVRAWGGDVRERRCLGDTLPVLVQAADEALQAAQVVVVTGGASVGERDFAKAMFRPFGLSLTIDKVAMKPGKPIWVGTARERIVIGLPGNPSAAMVTARLFLAPILAACEGRAPAEAWRWRSAVLAEALDAGGDRESFDRGLVGADGVIPIGNRESGAQKALAHADVLIRRPPNAPALAAGERIDTLDF